MRCALRWTSLACVVSTGFALSLLAGAARAQNLPLAQPDSPTRPPVYVVPLGPQSATLYADGRTVELDQYTIWRPACGNAPGSLTLDELIAIADEHERLMREQPAYVIDSGTRGAGINIIFNVSGNPPSGAAGAMAMAEAYLESLFSDPITVRISVSWQNLGGSVLGATSSNYTNTSYSNSRAGLVGGMDADDTIQSWLPSGSTIPVRYNGNSGTVTNENRIWWTVAAFRSTIGSISGTAASMTLNNQFNWDFDPSNGVGFSRMSLVDVVIHETGHALGFTSNADQFLASNNDMTALDIYRFQRSDGCCDYNPDTEAEFQTTPRLVDFNTPNDDHISDIISHEYRMSDGNPWQASHFREQNNNIGLMDPALSGGETHYPNFFSGADLNMFDAIGYDYPPCTSAPTITQQPADQQACVGDTVSFTVVSSDPAVFYQWRRGNTDLTDDGHFFGTQSPTLVITGVTAADAASNYNCVISDAQGCFTVSENAALTVSDALPTIVSQPQDVTVNEGETIILAVQTDNPLAQTFQWRKDGVPLSDDARISGSTSSALTITPAQLSDAGSYDVVVSDLSGLCSVISDPATVTVNTGGTTCPEDLNGDGVIDLQDLSVLLNNFGSTGASPGDGDIDGDGDVDLTDLSALLNAFGTSCP